MGALDTVGLDEPRRDELMAVLTAVLQLGNVAFVENEQTEAASVADPAHCEFAAQLLMLTPHRLATVLTTRSNTIRGETITKTLNCTESTANRDATAKRLFGEQFGWIVARLNESLAPALGSAGRSRLGPAGDGSPAGPGALAPTLSRPAPPHRTTSPPLHRSTPHSHSQPVLPA
jgi:myosin heavy subunit